MCNNIVELFNIMLLILLNFHSLKSITNLNSVAQKSLFVYSLQYLSATGEGYLLLWHPEILKFDSVIKISLQDKPCHDGCIWHIIIYKNYFVTLGSDGYMKVKKKHTHSVLHIILQLKHSFHKIIWRVVKRIIKCFKSCIKNILFQIILKIVMNMLWDEISKFLRQPCF